MKIKYLLYFVYIKISLKINYIFCLILIESKSEIRGHVRCLLELIHYITNVIDISKAWHLLTFKNVIRMTYNAFLILNIL